MLESEADGSNHFHLFLLSIFCTKCKASGALETNHGRVFVSLFGRDFDDCGTKDRPCQSIAQAVRQVNWEGDIYLNGSGTQKVPYNCSLPGEHRGIYVNKSLNIIGFLSPHLYCISGLYFQKVHDEPQIQVKFSEIVFLRTSLTFEDCQHIAIVNCSFRDATVVLSVQLRNITTLHLDISGSSFFHNNSQCIDLRFFENIMNRSRLVTININDTYFTRNGFHGGARSHRGGLRMASNKQTGTEPEQINVSCNNVKYVHNNGSFIDLYVANAVTNEIYKSVELASNNQTLYSLYFSNAKEPHVKFIRLQCIYSPSTRCIRIQSDKAEVEIHHSLFYRLFQALFFDSKISASLRIFRSSFLYNNAVIGGSLFATSPRGRLKIDVTNVMFSNCRAKKYGCMIAIGKPRIGKGRRQHNESIPDELYFTLRNVTVNQSDGKRSKCTAIYVLLKGGTVTIEDSRFNTKKQTSVHGALFVMTIGGKSNVTISNCSFADKGVTKKQGIAFHLAASNGNAGTVAISNSLFISSKKKQQALLLSPKYRIKLINTTMTLFRYGFQLLSAAPQHSAFPIDIYVDKCTFMNNAHDMLMTVYDPTSIDVTIQNTFFTSNETVLQNNYAIRFNIPPLKNLGSTNAVNIKLENDTFDSTASSNFALFFEGKKSMTIKGCTFRNCTYTYSVAQKWNITRNDDFYETGSGAISILTLPDKPLRNGCLRSNTIHDTHPLWHYESHVLFEDTVFEQNVGLTVGGIHISNGFTRFKRCVFQNNFGIQQSGHIYSAYGTGRVDLEDCLFSRTKERLPGFTGSSYIKAYFLYSESGGPVNLTNTTMISLVPARNAYRILEISSGGYVQMDVKSTMQCSEGSQLLFEDGTHIVYTEKNGVSCVMNVTVLRYSCHSCSPGYYSLQKGTSRGLLVNSTVHCLQCPFGASCIEQNIAAKPNFWGYQTSNKQQPLQFFPCPEHYCLRPLPDSKDFNHCHGNRNGVLCGRCAEGFTESLFSTECSETTECNHYWFWVLTILLTLGLALYLLIKPPILSFLGRQILWNRREQNQVSDGSAVNDNNEDSERGFLKITFYFYQVVELVMETSIESRLKTIPFLGFLISAFNFQVTTANNKIGCPFPGLTAVTKEFLLSGSVVLTMGNVLMVYCVHLFTNALRQKEKPKFTHYMAVVTEVLLLGYEKLAEVSLKLMHCVPIGSKTWLFIDGNVPCLQWWQYLLLAYIAVFVLPFTMVLYCGSSKLYKFSIKASEFLAACMLPLPFLIHWIFQDICKRRVRSDFTRNQELNKDVLKILHGPFRSPSAGNKGTIYWESVLIGRRLVLLACHTFIVDPMLRGVCMTSACFMMTIHHILKSPYRDPLANNAETLSLAVLTLIAAINLPGVTLISFGIDINTDASSRSLYLEALKWTEVCALAFIPALVSLFVTFAFLSQLMRFGVFLFKYIRRSCQFRVSERLIEENRLLIDMAGEPNTLM